MSPVGLVGVSHLTAPVEIRERFAFTTGEAVKVLGELREGSGVKEAVLLSTCNRTELYICPGSDPAMLDAGEALLCEKAGELLGGTAQYLYRRTGLESVQHLYRVASGLGSLVLGEAEIQGQVKDAYEVAGRVPVDPPLAGPILHRLFQSALAVGGRIRSETPIGEGAASVASVAVELARKIFGGLKGRQVMILGAGNTAELVVDALGRDGVRGVIVANRTYERARSLAERLGGRAVHFDEMPFVLSETDILVASTAAPHALLTLAGFRRAVGTSLGKPLLILDLAIPRDVESEVGGEANVFLYNVDDLHELVDGNLLKRQASVPEAEVIIEEQAAAFRDWFNSRDVVPVIRSLRGRWDDLREAELERILNRLSHLSPEDRGLIEGFSKRLVNKLLHRPTARLKQGAANGRGVEFVDAVRYLHDLDEAAGTGEAGGASEAGPEIAERSPRDDLDG